MNLNQFFVLVKYFKALSQVLKIIFGKTIWGLANLVIGEQNHSYLLLMLKVNAEPFKAGQ